MAEKDPLRDKKGHFLKGHPFMASKCGRKNGRKRTIERQVRDALGIAEDAMPEIIRAMIQRATSEDVPAAVRQAASEYLCDRIYGRPNQPLSNAGRTPLASFTFVLPDGSFATAKALLEEAARRDDSNED